MKQLKYMLLVAALMMAGTVSAKTVKTSHMYMFGFSASFKDSVIYVTDIQDVQGAWINTKTKFLMGRDQYAGQLQTHLSEQRQLNNRVCVVFFKKSKKKAEKQYLKLMKKYKDGYDIRYLNSSEFRFEAVDMTDSQ
jgi:hypothetical protein